MAEGRRYFNQDSAGTYYSLLEFFEERSNKHLRVTIVAERHRSTPVRLSTTQVQDLIRFLSAFVNPELKPERLCEDIEGEQ